MKVVRIRNIEIGAGMPKTCVPVTGTRAEQILEQTKDAVSCQPDLIEWRADFYEDLKNEKCVSHLAGNMREVLGEIPLIFTVRTQNEGGQCEITPQEYRKLLNKTAENPEIDIMDVEIFMDDAMVDFIQELQEKGKIVIASNHHFHRTPSVKEMEEIFLSMEKSGTDIRKLAVMPANAEDVLALLTATVAANHSGEAPVISMSMGVLGAVTRVAGQVFGSCVSFGTVLQASAPGQLELSDLKYFLEKLQL